MDECKRPAAEHDQNRVPVVQYSSVDTSTAGLKSPYQWQFCRSGVSLHGLWIDRGLSTSMHVTKVVSGCFAVLHQLYSICRSVSRESLIGLVVSLVLTWLDYWNAILAGLPAYQLDRLQSAVSAAARI